MRSLYSIFPERQNERSMDLVRHPSTARGLWNELAAGPHYRKRLVLERHGVSSSPDLGRRMILERWPTPLLPKPAGSCWSGRSCPEDRTIGHERHPPIGVFPWISPLPRRRHRQRRWCRGRRSVPIQPVANSVGRHRRPRVDVELAPDGARVRDGRVRADAQCPRDLRVGLPSRDQHQHLAFAT